MTKLKSCPFCGGEAEFVDCEVNPRWFVRCKKYYCVEQRGIWATKSEAAKLWNRRKEATAEKWILCSELLPGKSGRYIVTRGLNACGALWNRVYIANYSDLMGLKSERIWWDGNVGKSDFERIDDVIAWMPLPKPYMERSVDDRE